MMPDFFGENLFDDLFNPYWGSDFDRSFNHALAMRSPMGKRARNLMKTDVKETEGSYQLAVDLPGFKKDDVKVELKDGFLTIEASRSGSSDEKDKEGRYIRQERFTGSCTRSFYVGDEVKPGDVSAKFEDGILKLELPRKDVKKLPESNERLIEVK